MYAKSYNETNNIIDYAIEFSTKYAMKYEWYEVINIPYQSCLIVNCNELVVLVTF